MAAHIIQNKNLHPPANRRMKAFDESGHALTRPAGLILLFDGEVGHRAEQPGVIQINDTKGS